MRDSPLILVVEDEASLTTLLRYNLENHGFRVAAIENGADAMRAIAEAKPDLVLLDWMLPGVSGVEICRKIRRDPETHDLPIILLTARGEESDRIRGLDCGADDYVVKPFGIAELIARVGAVLRRAQPANHASSLGVGDIAMDLASHRVTRQRTQGPPGADGIPPAAPLPGASGPGAFARPLAGGGMGARGPHRAAHRRRARPPLAPGAHRRGRGGPDPDGALGRLRLRRLSGALSAARRVSNIPQPNWGTVSTALARASMAACQRAMLARGASRPSPSGVIFK